MADGTCINQAKEIGCVNHEEIVALQCGQVETSNKLAAMEGRLGVVESSLRTIQSMLKGALKMKGLGNQMPHV